MNTLEGVIPLFSGRFGGGLPKVGWTNQDLADLYRIEAALIQAGLSIETARGEGDEGDPWFVFCRPDTGDVLIHVARIDGEYVIASTGASFMLTGRSFTHIVKDFMAREPSFLLSNRRQNNVLLHPSSVLIAIFATLYIINQDADASVRVDSSELAARAGAHDSPYDLIPQLLSYALESRGGNAGQNPDTIFTPHNAFIILSSIAFASFTGAAHLMTVNLAAEAEGVSSQDGQEILLASLGDYVDIEFASDANALSQPLPESGEPIEEGVVATNSGAELETLLISFEEGEVVHAKSVGLPSDNMDPIAPAAQAVVAVENITLSMQPQVEAQGIEDSGSPGFYLPELVSMIRYVELDELLFDADQIPGISYQNPVVPIEYMDSSDGAQDFSYHFGAFAEKYTDAFYVVYDEKYYVFESQAMMDGDISDESTFVYEFSDGSSMVFVGISQEEFFNIA